MTPTTWRSATGIPIRKTASDGCSSRSSRPDTIRVEREGAHVKNAFVYRLRGYNGEPLVTGVPAD